MKKILLFATPLIVFALLNGCSEDHNAPTFGKYNDLPTPQGVVATYNASNDMLDVQWDMDDQNDEVTDYLVSWSDSSKFEEGNIGETYVNQTSEGVSVKNISMDAEDVLRTMKYYSSADIDSFIVYFRVSAVFNNDNYTNFVGPPADVDSALIKR